MNKNILLKILKDNSISMRSLAVKCGLSHTAISDIANNKRSPTYETCQKIAKALNMRVEDIFGMSEIPKVQNKLNLESEVKQLKQEVEELKQKLSSIEYLLKNILSK